MNEYFKGQKLIRQGEQHGKPPIAYIVSDPNAIHIFLSDKLEGGKHFPVHMSKIKKLWKPVEEQNKKSIAAPEELVGKQECLFPQEKTVRQIWRDKIIKKIK